LTDTNNCGSCGNICGAGVLCTSGVCVPSCPTGQVDCNGQCVFADNISTAGTYVRSTCGEAASPFTLACGGDAGQPAHVFVFTATDETFDVNISAGFSYQALYQGCTVSNEVICINGSSEGFDGFSGLTIVVQSNTATCGSFTLTITNE
jgi:hypothetical protein